MPPRTQIGRAAPLEQRSLSRLAPRLSETAIQKAVVDHLRVRSAPRAGNIAAYVLGGGIRTVRDDWLRGITPAKSWQAATGQHPS